MFNGFNLAKYFLSVMAQVQVSLAYINQQIQKTRVDLAQLRVPGGVHGEAFITDFDQVIRFYVTIRFSFFSCLLQGLKCTCI